MRLTFRAHERMKKPSDFQRARRKGLRRTGRFLILWAYDRRETPRRATRLGIQVGRKDGIAVRRNRFKRFVRDVFRRGKPLMARGWDVVISPRRGVSSPKEFPFALNLVEDDFRTLSRFLTTPSPADEPPAPSTD